MGSISSGSGASPKEVWKDASHGLGLPGIGFKGSWFRVLGVCTFFCGFWVDVLGALGLLGFGWKGANDVEVKP